MNDKEEKIEETEERFLSLDDLPDVESAYPRRKLWVPEWRRWVWVWALDIGAEGRIRETMEALPSLDADAKLRRAMVRRVIEAVRVSGELDENGKPPAPLFDLKTHFGWLERQPIGAITRICRLSQQLDGQDEGTLERMEAFFEMLPAVLGCLKHIASVSGACTGCPQNSQETCPLVLSGRLSLLTG